MIFFQKKEEKVTNINFIFRCIPFQILIITVLSIGGILGIVNDNGILFLYTGTKLESKYAIIAVIFVFIFVLMILLSYLICPIKFKKHIVIKYGVWQKTLSVFLVIIGCVLLVFNLYRLRVFEMILINPGLIAFNIIEERGAVVYISTMSVFFLGSAGLLDQTKTKYIFFCL